MSSAMGCFFISSIAMRCIGIQQGRYLEILSIMKMHGVRMYISHWDNWAIEVIAFVFLCCTYELFLCNGIVGEQGISCWITCICIC